MCPSTPERHEIRQPVPRRRGRRRRSVSLLRTLGRLSAESVTVAAGAVKEGAALGRSLARGVERLAADSRGTLHPVIRDDRVGIHEARTVGESAADRLIPPVREAAEMFVSVVAGTAAAVLGSPPARLALSVAVSCARSVATEVPGLRPPAADPVELSGSVATVAISTGTEAMLETLALVETAVRLPFGDVRGLHLQIDKGIQRMESLDIIPGASLPETLRSRARQVADRAPRRLLAALDGGVPEGSTRGAAILQAAREDGRSLGAFLIDYPRVLSLAGTHVVHLLATDSLTLAEIAAFLEGRNFRVREAPSRPTRRRQPPA